MKRTLCCLADDGGGAIELKDQSTQEYDQPRVVDELQDKGHQVKGKQPEPDSKMRAQCWLDADLGNKVCPSFIEQPLDVLCSFHGTKLFVNIPARRLTATNLYSPSYSKSLIS